jgi:hypothetical protein
MILSYSFFTQSAIYLDPQSMAAAYADASEMEMYAV